MRITMTAKFTHRPPDTPLFVWIHFNIYPYIILVYQLSEVYTGGNFFLKIKDVAKIANILVRGCFIKHYLDMLWVLTILFFHRGGATNFKQSCNKAIDIVLKISSITNCSIFSYFVFFLFCFFSPLMIDHWYLSGTVNLPWRPILFKMPIGICQRKICWSKSP